MVDFGHMFRNVQPIELIGRPDVPKVSNYPTVKPELPRDRTLRRMNMPVGGTAAQGKIMRSLRLASATRAGFAFPSYWTSLPW